MLGIVTKPMAQEIHYGDLACMSNQTNPLTLCNATSESELADSIDDIIYFLPLIYYLFILI